LEHEWIIFHVRYAIILPIDELIFLNMVQTTNQLNPWDRWELTPKLRILLKIMGENRGLKSLNRKHMWDMWELT
jgi:hypothetical protein